MTPSKLHDDDLNGHPPAPLPPTAERLNMTPAQQQQLRISLLNLVLQGQDEDFKNRVLELTMQFGLDADDPLFLTQIGLNQVQLLLEEAPTSFQDLLDHWTERLHTTFKQYETALNSKAKVAAKLMEKDLQSMVDGLVRHTTKIQYVHTLIRNLNLMSLSLTGVVLLTALILGGMAGMLYERHQQQTIDPTGLRQLTLKEANLLEWAKSADGQLAYNIMDWNRYLLKGKGKNRECVKQIESKGLGLTWYGKTTEYSSCVLWIVPPEERQVIE